MTPASSRPLRILARPYRRTAEPGQGRVYDELIARGHTIEELSLRRVLVERWDIVHIHYPESVVRRQALLPSVLGVILLWVIVAVARMRPGTTLVGTGHNLGSHEKYHPLLESLAVGAFDRAVGAMTYPSRTAAELVPSRRRRLEAVRSNLVPIVNYRWERREIDREAARAEIGAAPEDAVVLSLGLIRPYKNVPHLIDTFVATSIEGRLVVAGTPNDADTERSVRSAAEGDSRVRLELRYIEEEEVSSLMAAADLVVLPFTSVLNSASALLALSHDRPILVPHGGALDELAAACGEGWVHFYDDELRSEDLERAVAASRPSGAPDLTWCSLERVVDLTEEFYRSLV